ncbi:hypothetical protein E1193_12590 [Micromonospora sp. KC606]|uniref:hypothetical protein n=1 Tax=Micromonospora sp. KC606 TaxID=2530379 RepID=UPI00104AEDB2|nr:hypothetical protein [Micromonospora sp. KC606]TDC82188.1 hypothetical protein E1193_12590 [Micromonospora sp. KC606]
MNRLEERYRLLLRLLPADYRREWEDDMVAAFLESMDTGDAETAAYAADYGRPRLSEVASVIALAARLRLGGTNAPPRSYAWGQAVRLAALTATLVHAVMATAGVAITAWLAGRMAWLPAPAPEWALIPPGSLWRTAWGLADYAWLPAYVALVLGHRRIAQALALLAILPPAVTNAVQQATGEVPPSASPWMMLLLDVVLVLAMSAFHHDAEPVPRRRWLGALPIGILLVPVPLFAIQATSQALRLLDWPGLSCALVSVAIVIHLAGRQSHRPSGALPWSLALTLLAAAALALRTATLPDHSHQAQHSALLTIGAVQATLVLAVGAPLAVLAIRALRRLPPAADDL